MLNYFNGSRRGFFFSGKKKNQSLLCFGLFSWEKKMYIRSRESSKREPGPVIVLSIVENNVFDFMN